MKKIQLVREIKRIMGDRYYKGVDMKDKIVIIEPNLIGRLRLLKDLLLTKYIFITKKDGFISIFTKVGKE